MPMRPRHSTHRSCAIGRQPFCAAHDELPVELFEGIRNHSETSCAYTDLLRSTPVAYDSKRRTRSGISNAAKPHASSASVIKSATSASTVLKRRLAQYKSTWSVRCHTRPTLYPLGLTGQSRLLEPESRPASTATGQPWNPPRRHQRGIAHPVTPPQRGRVAQSSCSAIAKPRAVEALLYQLQEYG